MNNTTSIGASGFLLMRGYPSGKGAGRNPVIQEFKSLTTLQTWIDRQAVQGRRLITDLSWVQILLDPPIDKWRSGLTHRVLTPTFS